MRKHLTPGVALGVIAIVFAMTGSAVAGSLITSAKIKDGTIQNKDIKKGTISLNRLTKGAQKAVQRLALAGPAGPAGANGADGAPGARVPRAPQGATLQPAPGPSALVNWGTMNRNTIGSASVTLRAGPADAAARQRLAQPHRQGRAHEKVAFGDEVDSVAGGLFANVKQVGFRVYTTRRERQAPAASPNMPGITFEVDPNSAATPSNYSSLVFIAEQHGRQPVERLHRRDVRPTGTVGRHRRRVHRATRSTSTRRALHVRRAAGLPRSTAATRPRS